MAEVAVSLTSVQVPQWLTNISRGVLGNLSLNPATAVIGGIKGAMQGNDAAFSDRFGSFATTGNASQLQQGLASRAAALNGTKTTVDPNVLKDQISKEQQRLALLGPLANAEDAVRAKQLEINAAALNGVGISKDQAKAIIDVTRAQAEMSRVTEQAGIGIYRTADATKAMNDNLQAAISKKLLDPNNPQEYTAALNSMTKQMEDLSDQAKVASAVLPQLQAAFNDATSARKQLDSLAVESMSINRSFFVEFGQNLRNGANAWDSFKTAGLNALGKLADKLMGMAADNLFAKAFGGSSSGGGLFGLLGGLFGVGGSGAAAQAASANTLASNTGGAFFGPGFASGTNSAPGGLALVGENGPELVNLPKGSQVFNNGQTRGMMGGGGGSSPNVTIVQHNDYSNADPGSEARMRQYTDQSRKMAVNEAVQAVRTVQNQNPAYLRGGR
jgi:hypothetical protein